MVYGRTPPPLLSYGSYRTANDTLDEQLQNRDQALSFLKENLATAQGRMKKYADLKRTEWEFSVGEFVFLKIRPYRQKTLAKRRNEKLSAKFFGPFEILQRVGKVAYRLKLPEATTIHPVFHVSQLKPVKGTNFKEQPIPPYVTDELEWLAVPEEVYATGVNEVTEAKEALISWKGLPPEEATWGLRGHGAAVSRISP